ncbi:MAG: aminopeptidase P family protein [Armatimonadetes bacterium]|nr:aminopeptidase P family protein [Armatimonadota bacterium]
MSQSLEKLRSRMSEAGIDAMLVTAIDNVRWLTGFSGSSGAALVTQSDGIFISDSRYREQAGEEVRGLPVEIYQSPKSLAETMAEAAKNLGLPKLAFEAEHVSVATFNSWKERFNGVALEPASNIADQLRMVKTAEEIEKIKAACGVADSCWSHVQRMLQPGVSEYDIGLDIEFFIRRLGAQLAFSPIVVSGPRSARPHGYPSERKLENGDFVTMDFGANVDGYNSDITRTIVIGEPTKRHREIWNAVLEAQLAAIDAIRPGKGAQEIDALSREVLAKYDFAKYFGHGLGHGLGRLVHDIGGMNAVSKDILEEGQVWTVEPGVYIEAFGGVRIEDDIVVTADGCELLTHSPKQISPT